MADSKKGGKVIYVYDALCGWCYGFHSVMEALYTNHKEELDFEIISGGMITGNRIGRIGDVAPYIKWAYKDVERATGVRFGEAFLSDILEKGKAIFSSVPAAIALTAFKAFQPDQAVLFAGALQKAIYFDGIEPLDMGHYVGLAEAFGVDPSEYQKQLAAPATQQAVEAEFGKATALNVTGFPTVFFASPDQHLILIARGYTNLLNLEQHLQKARVMLISKS